MNVQYVPRPQGMTTDNYLRFLCSEPELPRRKREGGIVLKGVTATAVVRLFLNAIGM
jgi:hypothetical protein